MFQEKQKKSATNKRRNNRSHRTQAKLATTGIQVKETNNKKHDDQEILFNECCFRCVCSETNNGFFVYTFSCAFGAIN